MVETTKRLIEEFLAMIGLELVPELMEDGLLSLAIDDKLTVTIGECPAEQLVMCAMVGSVDADRALRLLAANAFSEQTCPVIYAFDENSKEGVAWCRLPASVDAGGMYHHFHEFITTVMEGETTAHQASLSVGPATQAHAHTKLSQTLRSVKR